MTGHQCRSRGPSCGINPRFESKNSTPTTMRIRATVRDLCIMRTSPKEPTLNGCARAAARRRSSERTASGPPQRPTQSRCQASLLQHDSVAKARSAAVLLRFGEVLDQYPTVRLDDALRSDVLRLGRDFNVPQAFGFCLGKQLP